MIPVHKFQHFRRFAAVRRSPVIGWKFPVILNESPSPRSDFLATSRGGTESPGSYPNALNPILWDLPKTFFGRIQLGTTTHTHGCGSLPILQISAPARFRHTPEAISTRRIFDCTIPIAGAPPPHQPTGHLGTPLLPQKPVTSPGRIPFATWSALVEIQFHSRNLDLTHLLRQQKSNLHRLLIIQSRIDRASVVPAQVRLSQITGPPGAFGNILTRQFKMNTR